MDCNFSIYVDITKVTGSKVVGRCPLHDDKSPSFYADQSTGMWTCYAGCGSGSLEVLEFLLSKNSYAADLAKTKVSAGRQRGSSRQKLAGTPYQFEAEYIYRDHIGFPKLKVVRSVHPNKGKKFTQYKFRDGIWASGGYAGTIAPYRFHDWKDQPGIVFLVEGEKKVDALFLAGLLSSTTPKGALAWKPEFAKFFNGRDVVILPDNDPAGLRYSRAAAGDIKSAASSLKILQLPTLNAGGDVYDWIQAGGTSAELLALVHSCPVVA